MNRRKLNNLHSMIHLKICSLIISIAEKFSYFINQLITQIQNTFMAENV